ncbi:transmembrane protein 201-like [Mizuhopecten yessoensis]|uniref:Transmembrane protein 201 n=1 Tax=Mizuhopecten yessoensis TaxID=6573 RepID=A0A210Q5P3_MIZYE|nr:transmembrane protein 201-like [Mizuhopecten yessoensis]OWF44063.1 Transmembrane protein 201 [Mizuhopecten yessoensis]
MIYLLLLATASSVAICVVLYKYLRPKFPIKVECWFCEKVTVVPYGNKNCWDCPGCDQYNGFKEDGHYNKPIPAQYSESMNHPVSCKTDEFISKDTVLCDECSQNQLLKVRQLAAFVPFNENKFDAEVEAFEQHLERVYRLCDVCQGTINMELGKQDHVLGMKLDQVAADVSKSSETSFEEKVSSGTKVKTFLYKTPGVPLSVVMATVSSMCASTLCMTHCHTAQQQLQTTWLPTSYFIPIIHLALTKLDVLGGIGILTCFLAKYFVGKNRLHMLDAVNIPLWILSLLLDSQFGQIVFGQGWTPVVSCIHHGVNAVTGILCLLVSRRSRSQPNINIKRLSLDNSRSSQGSDSTLTDSSPLKSVSEAAYSQVYDPRHMSSQLAPHKSDRLDDALSDLGSFSIGSASLKRSASGVFGCSSFTTGQPVSKTGFSFGQALQDRSNRPLISPAKLRVSHTGGWSTQNRADNPFLQAKRETSMFKVDSGPSNFNLGHANQTPNIFADKTSFFNDTTSFKGDNPGAFNEKGSCFSENFSTPVPKSNFNDHGSTVSGRFPSCDDSVRKSWSVRNHAINKMEDFHDDRDSRSTASSMCPVDSTTKTEIKSKVFWRSSGFIGFVLGASFVVNVFLTYNSWKKPS